MKEKMSLQEATMLAMRGQLKENRHRVTEETDEEILNRYNKRLEDQNPELVELKQKIIAIVEKYGDIEYSRVELTARFGMAQANLYVQIHFKDSKNQLYGNIYTDKSKTELMTGSGPNVLNDNFINCLSEINALLK